MLCFNSKPDISENEYYVTGTNQYTKYLKPLPYISIAETLYPYHRRTGLEKLGFLVRKSPYS